MTYGVIYTITNTRNGKQYVGQTTRPLSKRWAKHVGDALTMRERGCRALQNAIRKYGPDAFGVEAIVACDDQEELDRMEALCIETGSTLSPHGYNLRRGGNGHGKHHPDSRRKIGEANKRRIFSQETRLKIGQARKGRGHPHSPETRAKMSVAQKGKIVSLDTRAKFRAVRRPDLAERNRMGLSEETRTKISEAKKGKSMSLEARIKMSVAGKGRPKSLEHRLRISAANMRPVIRGDGMRFDSVTAAAHSVRGGVSGVSMCCRGKLKTSGGFSWRYADALEEK